MSLGPIRYFFYYYYHFWRHALWFGFMTVKYSKLRHRNCFLGICFQLLMRCHGSQFSALTWNKQRWIYKLSQNLRRISAFVRKFACSVLHLSLEGKKGIFSWKMVKLTTLIVWLCIAMLFIESCHTWRRRRRRRRRRPPPPPPPPPCHRRDCSVSGWSNWGSCSYPCGTGGIQLRTRYITRVKNQCGQCPYHFTERKRCNIGLCANYGQPHSSGCYCRSGYTGTCCRTGKFLRSKC